MLCVRALTAYIHNLEAQLSDQFGDTPTTTAEMEAKAESWATTLISANKGNWHLVDRRPRRAGKPKDSASGTKPTPPESPETG